MRTSEAAYWDGQFAPDENGLIRDNIYKRQQILRRVLGHDLIGKTLFEIGVGHGTLALALHNLLHGSIKYGGSEVSAKQAALLRSAGLSVVQADVKKLPIPSGYVDVLFAFDSLEHVRPEDREEGNREIARILKPKGKVLIHLPMEQTRHDLEFDHGFIMEDLGKLADMCRARIELTEVYSVEIPAEYGGPREYLWAVLGVQ